MAERDPNTGHWLRGGPSPNPGGLTRGHRRALGTLATSIRSVLGDGRIEWWLMCMATGVDPDDAWDAEHSVWERAREDDRVPRVLADGRAILRTIDLATRRWAAQTLVERGWGQAAQHVIIEAEVRSQINDAIAAGDDEMGALTDEQLRVLDTLARRRGAIGHPSIVDADSTEVPR